MNRTTRLGLGALVLFWGCSSPSPQSTALDAGPSPLPGQTCDPTTAPTVVVHFDPLSLVLAPGESRPVTVIVDPDMCAPVTGTFTIANASLA